MKIKADPHAVLTTALDTAIQSAMNKTDKWCGEQLTEAQRETLATQVHNFFWLTLDETGVEIE